MSRLLDVSLGLAGQVVPHLVEQLHGLSPSGWLVHELIGELGVEERKLAKRVHEVRPEDERVAVAAGAA